MGAQAARPNIDVGQYAQKFKATSRDCQNGPNEHRSCQDICCLVTFIILTLVFAIGGIYFIATMDTNNFQAMKDSWATAAKTNSTGNSTTKAKHEIFIASKLHHEQTGMASGMAGNQLTFPSMASAIPYICLMGLFSLILSVVLVIAISKIPRIVIYGMIVLTFVLIAVGIVGGIVFGAPQISIFFGIFGLIWAILISVMLCCWKDQFQAAIVLLKVTGTFLRNKPAVILAPFLVMFISFFYFAFWLVSFIAIQLHRSPESMESAQQHQFNFYDGVSLVWLFLSVFYSYFLYYVMVFLIGTATALWYFNIEGNFIFKGLSNIWNSHIGSLTFASLLVTIVSMLKSTTQNKNNGEQNPFGSCCICIVRCCLTVIEDLIRVLNHNSVIVMSFTGEGFIDSAKTAIYLIFNQFGLFISVEMVDFLLNMSVFFLTIILPSGVGFLLLKLTYNDSAQSEVEYLVFSTLIIFTICLLISLLTITILAEALSCVFIFYCLNQQFRTLNYGSTNNVPRELENLFSEIESQSRQSNNDYANNVNPINNNNGYQAPLQQPNPNYNYNQPPRQPSYNNPYDPNVYKQQQPYGRY